MDEVSEEAGDSSMSVTTDVTSSGEKLFVIDELLLSDTCDAAESGVEAAVIRLANTRDGKVSVLDLCAHHFTRHELALMQQGFVIHHDRRDALSESYR